MGAGTTSEKDNNEKHKKKENKKEHKKIDHGPGKDKMFITAVILRKLPSFVNRIMLG